MTSQVASSLLLVAGEVLALLRDWLTRRRQEQAAELKPAADDVKAKLDSLVAEALAREAARRSAAAPSAPATEAAAGGEQEHDELLQREVERLVRDALARAASRHAGTLPADSAMLSPGSPGTGSDIDALRREIEHLVHEALLHPHAAPQPGGASTTASVGTPAPAAATKETPDRG